MRGGDFSWDNWAGLPPAELAAHCASTAALLEPPESPIRRLLSGLQALMCRPRSSGKGEARCGVYCLVTYLWVDGAEVWNQCHIFTTATPSL